MDNMWNTLFVIALATGALAQFSVPAEIKQRVQDTFKAECKKNGAEDKYQQAENATLLYINCVKSHVNFEVMKNEIEAAKPTGSVDEVFKKYCDKVPQIHSCRGGLIEAVKPCLDVTIRDNLDVLVNASDSLTNFVCDKDGERIALFIAEAGPECFQTKADQLNQCAIAAKGSITSADQVKALPTKELCSKYDALSKCVVDALEQCDNPTPANMAESVFRFVRKTSPCKDLPVAN